MDASVTDMEQAVTLILQGLAHLAVLPQAMASPAPHGLAPALAALVRALQERAPAQEAR
jgi:hypothetical protein